jgi:hypothetical protein
MEEALTAHLLADPALGGLVGPRIFWGERPQGQPLPAVVLLVVDGNPDYAMRGATGLKNTRLQVDCWGRSYSEARQVANAASDALHGFLGLRGSVDVQASFLDAERDLSENSGEGGRLFRRSLDFILWHGKGV